MLRPWVAIEVARHLAALEAAEKPTIALHIRGGDKVQEDQQAEVRSTDSPMTQAVSIGGRHLPTTALHIRGSDKVQEIQ